MSYDMWLPSDYLARYYSLYDISILAPIFVMVIEFRLCDGDEFRLCDSILSFDCVSPMSSVFVTPD